ncbi:MAG: SRPBCC domain-containing protein, partial [Acidobacteria bacterium]|nr:SRPBCC domain-containing protein [Acidobacteriota bacterium]
TMWGRWTFRDLTPFSRIVLVTSFVDENEQPIAPPMVKDFPVEMLSTTTFEERGGKTLVTLRSRAMYASPAQRQTFAGFFQSMEQGWGGTFDKLVTYLESEEA